MPRIEGTTSEGLDFVVRGGKCVITLTIMSCIEGTTSVSLGFVVLGGTCVITLRVPCTGLIERPER